jgi:hypothetical protein
MNSIFTLTQAQLSESLYSMISNTYHRYWLIDEEEQPMIDNATFITYRARSDNQSNVSLMASFHQFTREMVRVMGPPSWSRSFVHQRQAVGMYAMDYAGTRDGRFTDDTVDPHIHAVLVINPHVRLETERLLSVMLDRFGTKFYWQPLDRKDGSVQDSIHYCLKGIMHENGFYQGRSDRYDVVGPRVDMIYKL